MTTGASTIAPNPPPALPFGDTFDILPSLHELLSRIDHQATIDPSTGLDTANDLTYAESTPLEPRELPTEVLAIKSKIRRAIKEIEKLPDVDRSVEQQEQEIVALESRIAKQKSMLKQMSDTATASFG